MMLCLAADSRQLPAVCCAGRALACTCAHPALCLELLYTQLLSGLDTGGLSSKSYQSSLSSMSLSQSPKLSQGRQAKSVPRQIARPAYHLFRQAYRRGQQVVPSLECPSWPAFWSSLTFASPDGEASTSGVCARQTLNAALHLLTELWLE
jgi:hypothetical protein